MPGKIVGLRTIRNLSNSTWKIIKKEYFVGSSSFFGGSGTLIVPANGHSTFRGESIPWVTNQAQVDQKAFLFSKNPTHDTNGQPFWYLFQDEVGVICRTPYRGANTSYEQRLRYAGDDANISIEITQNDSISIAPA